MISSLIFILWILINILFLFNFNLPVGYLVIVNLSFIIASLLTETETQDRI